MNRYQFFLAALAAMALIGMAIAGHSVAAAIATLVLCAATSVYIFVIYRRVRAQRKAREKAEILRRVAVLEDQRRRMAPVASSADLSLREFGGPAVAERATPPGAQ